MINLLGISFVLEFSWNFFVLMAIRTAKTVLTALNLHMGRDFGAYYTDHYINSKFIKWSEAQDIATRVLKIMFSINFDQLVGFRKNILVIVKIFMYETICHIFINWLLVPGP